MSASSEHPEIAQILDHFRENEKSLIVLTASLSDGQLKWQPEQGRAWSILQCVEHLALAHSAYLQAMWPTVRLGQNFVRRGPIKPSALGALFLRKLEPPVKSKAPAPKMIVPAGAKDKESVLAGFLAVHEQIRTFTAQAASLDLNRLKFRNPLFPLLRVRVGTGLLIMAAHERRHLWQAGRVREALEQDSKVVS